MSPLVVLLTALRPVLSGPTLIADTADGRFRIHYTVLGADALAHGAADAAPKNGRPDDVDAIASGLSRVVDKWSGRLHMRSPLADGGDGGDARIDLYVRRLEGARGAAHTEAIGPGAAASAWLELDPRTALISPGRLEAAAGHEAHHAIQYAYATLPRFLHEATSSYVEHADFADPALSRESDDHAALLRAHPEVSFDATDGQHEYAEQLLIRRLVADGAGEAALVRLWERAAATDNLVDAIEAAAQRSVGVLIAEQGVELLTRWAGAGPAGTTPLVATSRRRASMPRLAALWVDVAASGCEGGALTITGSPNLHYASRSESPRPLRGPIRLAASPETLVIANPDVAAISVEIALELAPPCDAGIAPPASSSGCALAAAAPAPPGALLLVLVLVLAWRLRRPRSPAA